MADKYDTQDSHKENSRKKNCLEVNIATGGSRVPVAGVHRMPERKTAKEVKLFHFQGQGTKFSYEGN